MIKHILVACIVLLLNQSCHSQSRPLNELLGKWIVQTDQRYFEQNGKTVETFQSEKIPANEAYVYDFKSDTLLTVTNLKKEFQWDFKIEKKDSVLTLLNINGDAEDDELIYKIAQGKLTLLRKMEDADPNDDTKEITVCNLMTLKKL